MNARQHVAALARGRSSTARGTQPGPSGPPATSRPIARGLRYREAVVWISLSSALVAGHLVGDVVWIGALLAANDLLSRAPWMAEPAEVGALARRVYQRLAQPALLLCLATGGVMVGLSPGPLLHARWFFAKMAFALALILLHRLVGARAARIADGRTRGGAGAGFLTVLVLLCATGAIAVEVTKALPRF